MSRGHYVNVIMCGFALILLSIRGHWISQTLFDLLLAASNLSEPSYRILEARGVSPRCGNVLVFPHGDTMGSLVHEGSAVTAGVKYVIRSDVLYETRKTEPRASRPEDRGGGSNGSSVKKHRSN